MFDAEFNPSTRRLHLRYSGFWTIDDARKVKDKLAQTLRHAAAGGRPFTLLDDFRSFSVQIPEVVEFNKGFAAICEDFPISRNAMIVPSALVRNQVQRTVDTLENCRVFQDYEEADHWLGEVEGDGG